MINKTFRLFISSTFDDFKEERELLNEEVFSKVDRYCQKKGYNFQLVDLRWGINSEAALMQNTLSICIEEVRRCKELSPKPNFLIMVGERYGWIPLPFKIGVNEFETIVSACNAEEAFLLQSWYLLDENEIGGIYYLKARTAEFSDDAVWGNVETNLHNILCTYATKCNLSRDFVDELNTSATEAEIIEGLLSDEEKRNSTLAVFRFGHSKKDADTTKIEALKQKILDHLGGSENQNNVVLLKYDEGYCTRFCEKITSLLIKHIDAEILRLETQKDSFNNDAILNQILADCEAGYFNREGLLKEIENYVQSDSRVPLFVTGFSGSGKSTLLADYLRRTSVDAFFSFYGLSENSYSLVDSLNQIFKEMQIKYSLLGSFEVRMTNISEVTHRALYAIPSSKIVLIVIDGLDMFADIQQLHENVFPTQLPANVKLILSAANDNVVSKFKQAHANELQLKNIDPALCYETFSKLLKQHNRCISNPLQKQQIKTVIAKGATPMHVKLMSAHCLYWKSDDVNCNLAENAQTTALQNISSMFEKLGHNRDFVLYTLGLISAAPFGITEEEIQQLVLRFPAVKAYFVAEDRHQYNRDKLPFVIWSRLFYDLKDCLTLTRENGCIVVKFRHSIFDTVLRATFPQYLREARDLLAQFYIEQNNYCVGLAIPNLRKAYNLLALLRKNNDVVNMRRSLEDLSFVDTVVKIGHVEELIDTCNYVLSKTVSTDGCPLFTRLYNCLQNNRNRLLCYRDCFYNCAYEYGLLNGKKPVLYSKIKYLNNQFIPFHYSRKSAISWMFKESRYAVCHGSYVYILDKNTGSEVCRVFLGLNHAKEPQTAKNAIWIDKNTIAIACQKGPLLVYNISNEIPSLMHSFAFNDEDIIVRYVKDHQMLLYVNEQKLYARNPLTGNEYFSIPMSAPISWFDVDTASEELYLCTDPFHIRVYNLRHGDYKSTLRTRKKRRFIDDWGRKLLGGYGVLKISDKLWFIYAPALLDAPALYSVFNVAEKKMTFLSLPAMHTGIFSSRILFGERSCVIIFDDVLYYVDLKENYKLSYYPAESISDVAWMIMDDKVSVLSQNGLEVVGVDTFFPVDERTCVQSNREPINSLFLALRNMRKLAAVASIALTPNPLAYSRIFLLEQYANSNVWNKNTNIASIIIESNDGKTAVAYEASDAIVVYSAEGKLLLKIDKMHLAINDNILNMDFSPDGQYLFVWRNHSLALFDIKTGTKAMKLDLSYRPALNARFGDNSQSFVITLCDEKEYVFHRIKNRFIAESPIPKRLVPEIDLDAYFGPCNIYPTKNQPRSYTRINADAFDSISCPRKWFSDVRVYFSESHWILYDNGHFYLNGDVNSPFTYRYCHFEDALQMESQSDASEFAMYLRQKNDFLSRILEVDSRYFVLISRMFNAVILFDIQNLEIVATHKLYGNILGIRKANGSFVEVFTDASSNPISLEINLY